MPVIRRIKLSILSKDDIQELENNIIRLETLAKRKEAIQAKMKQVKARRGTTRTNAGGGFGMSQGSESGLPRSMERQMEAGQNDRLAESKSANKQRAKDTRSAAAIIKTPPFTKLLNRTSLLEDGLDKATHDLGELNGIMSDPVAFISNMTRSSKFVVKLFKVAAVVTILHAMIIGIAKGLFGPGGALDIRKLFKDETASINQLQLLVDISQGKTYYSSDLRAYSHIVNNSSTEKMGQHDQLYKEINIGSDII